MDKHTGYTILMEQKSPPEGNGVLKKYSYIECAVPYDYVSMPRQQA